MARFYFIPEDYEPNEKTLKAAKKLGLTEKQVFEELENCQDHQYKRPMMDPDRCFRNWLKNAVKWGHQVPISEPTYRKPELDLTPEQRADNQRAFEKQIARFKGARK